MLIIGHRGARGLAPENTIASFKKALEHGADWLEFDVRVTKDGVAVVHHDAVLKDDSGNRLKIEATDYEELQQHKSDLMTLAEALKFVSGRVPLYVEVKRGSEVKPVIRELSKYRHRFSLASKSQTTLRQLHDAMPKIPTIVIEPWSGIRASWRARQIGTKTISMNQAFLWFGFIQAMKGSGYKLFAYPLNNPAKAKRWAKHGLAGVITDFPDRFKNT